MLNSNKYIKVIGITAALLLFGLINSVSAIVFPVSNVFESSDKISIYPGSSNGHDIQSAFTFESGNNANFSAIFSGTLADQSQATSYPPIELAPASALYLGYDLGLQSVTNKKDYLYSFANPTGTDFMANIKWHDVNSGSVPATRVGRSVMIDYTNEWTVGGRDDFMTFSYVNATMGNHAMHDPATDSIITEWSSGISVSRSVPDPATLVLLGLGMVGIGVVRWRKVFAKKSVFKSTPQREVCSLVSSPDARSL